MTSWLVVPRRPDGSLRVNLMQVVEADSEGEAATSLYMNAVVLGPVFVGGAGRDDGPVARLPAEGQPQ